VAIYNITATGQNIEAEAAFMAAQYPSGGYTLVTPDGAFAPSLGTVITPRAFFDRIGAANEAWLYAQAQTNSTLEMYKDTIWSGPVDLANPQTATDLTYLLTLTGTPFTSASLVAIVSAPVQANEVG
jgi:hypothetical protein